LKILFDHGADGGAPFLGFDLPASLRLYAAGEEIPEALKGYAPKVVNGKRNGISVPPGARWVYLYGNDALDLEGECLDLDVFKQFAGYTIREAGWLDYNHYSRPGRFPTEWLGQGASPQDFKLGKITDLQFRGSDWFAEGFLWPEGDNHHTDVMWKNLKACPESIHTSPGGPIMGREEFTLPNGQRAKRLKMLVNHIALCDQATNPNGTRASLEPIGPYAEGAKSLASANTSFLNIPAHSLIEALKGMPCGTTPTNDLEHYLLDDEEAGKSAITAGGPGGTVAQGHVTEDLEGEAVQPGSGYMDPDGEHFKSSQHAALFLMASGLPFHLATQAAGDPMSKPSALQLIAKMNAIAAGLAQDEAHKGMPQPGSAPAPRPSDADGVDEDEDEGQERDDDEDSKPPAPGGEEGAKADLSHTLLQHYIASAVAEGMTGGGEALKSLVNDAVRKQLAPIKAELQRIAAGVSVAVEGGAEALKALHDIPGARPVAPGQAVSSSRARELDAAGRARANNPLAEALKSFVPEQLPRGLTGGEIHKCQAAGVIKDAAQANYLAQGTLPDGLTVEVITKALGGPVTAN
jgi:hypothetical protein